LRISPVSFSVCFLDFLTSLLIPLRTPSSSFSLMGIRDFVCRFRFFHMPGVSRQPVLHCPFLFFEVFRLSWAFLSFKFFFLLLAAPLVLMALLRSFGVRLNFLLRILLWGREICPCIDPPAVSAWALGNFPVSSFWVFGCDFLTVD